MLTASAARITIPIVTPCHSTPVHDIAIVRLTELEIFIKATRDAE